MFFFGELLENRFFFFGWFDVRVIMRYFKILFNEYLLGMCCILEYGFSVGRFRNK